MPPPHRVRHYVLEARAIAPYEDIEPIVIIRCCGPRNGTITVIDMTKEDAIKLRDDLIKALS